MHTQSILVYKFSSQNIEVYPVKLKRVSSVFLLTKQKFLEIRLRNKKDYFKFLGKFLIDVP